MTIPTALRRLPARIPVRAAAFALRIRWVESLEVERDQAHAATIQARRAAERLDDVISSTEKTLRSTGHALRPEQLDRSVDDAIELERQRFEDFVQLLAAALRAPKGANGERLWSPTRDRDELLRNAARRAHDAALTRSAIDQRDRAVALAREMLTSPAMTRELADTWRDRLLNLLGPDGATVCTCTYTARTGGHDPVRDASRCTVHFAVLPTSPLSSFGNELGDWQTSPNDCTGMSRPPRKRCATITDEGPCALVAYHDGEHEAVEVPF